MFPVFEIFENALFDAQSAHLVMKRNVLRLLLVIMTLVIAATVPHFGLFISLIGNLGSSMLMFVLPVRTMRLSFLRVLPLKFTLSIDSVGIVLSGDVSQIDARAVDGAACRHHSVWRRDDGDWHVHDDQRHH